MCVLAELSSVCVIMAMSGYVWRKGSRSYLYYITLTNIKMWYVVCSMLTLHSYTHVYNKFLLAFHHQPTLQCPLVANNLRSLWNN